MEVNIAGEFHIEQLVLIVFEIFSVNSEAVCHTSKEVWKINYKGGVLCLDQVMMFYLR